MSLYLSALVEDHFGEVERFCIEDLAGIFYRCLEHEEPRDETDWLTAERWVDGRLKTTKFTEKYLYFSVYEEFRKLDKNLREISSYSSSRLNDIEFFNIKEYVASKIDRDEFKKIISKLSPEDRRENMKRFLGRDIWDELYQPFIRMIEDAKILNGSKYGEILFY